MNVERVEKFLRQLGAEFAETTEKNTYFINESGLMDIKSCELNVYRFGDYYLFVDELHYLDQDFWAISFGESIDEMNEQACPFPVDLSDEEIIRELKYSLGIEPYPDLSI